MEQGEQGEWQWKIINGSGWLFGLYYRDWRRDRDWLAGAALAALSSICSNILCQTGWKRPHGWCQLRPPSSLSSDWCLHHSPPPQLSLHRFLFVPPSSSLSCHIIPSDLELPLSSSFLYALNLERKAFFFLNSVLFCFMSFSNQYKLKMCL